MSKKEEVSKKIYEILCEYEFLDVALEKSDELIDLLLLRGAYEACDLYNAGGISLDDAIFKGVIVIEDAICVQFSEKGRNFYCDKIRERICFESEL